MLNVRSFLNSGPGSRRRSRQLCAKSGRYAYRKKTKSARLRISLSHILRDCDQFRIPIHIASKLASDKAVRPYSVPAAAIPERGYNLQHSPTNLSLDHVL